MFPYDVALLRVRSQPANLHSTLCKRWCDGTAEFAAPPTAGILAVSMACFLINMIPGYSRLVCSRTFESLRMVHNFSVALTSELAMNPHEDSVPFGSREPIIFGVRNPF